MLQMFYMTVWDSYAEDWNNDEVLEKLYSLADSSVMLGELPGAATVSVQQHRLY